MVLFTFVRMEIAGLFDLQVNGYAGVDFNDAAITPAALDHALSIMRSGGVAHCLPTVISAGPEMIRARLCGLDKAVSASRLGSLMVPGYHLEGPFLSAADGYVGCHPPSAMRDPDVEFVEALERELARPILLITLAPERSGSEAFIRWATGRGKVVALGHTAAAARDIELAVEAGATLSTHLGNALKRVQPKFDNPMMLQLAEDRLWASVIADGIHVPPYALKVMLRAKGLERTILVTDATSAAAAPAGAYMFAGMAIERDSAGMVRAPGLDVLAGSALTLEQAVRNVVAWGLGTQEAAQRMAADNPRALLAPALAAHGVRLSEAA